MPDIQTALKSALATDKNLKLKPYTEQAWLWLRDHPRSRLQTLNKVFKREMASTVNNLKTRGMLKTEIERDPRTNNRHISFYSVLEKEYDLLPMPALKAPQLKAPPKAKKLPEPAPTAIPAPAEVPVTVAIPSPEPVGTVTPDFDIDALTLGQARALFAKLSRILK